MDQLDAEVVARLVERGVRGRARDDLRLRHAARRAVVLAVRQHGHEHGLGASGGEDAAVPFCGVPAQHVEDHRYNLGLELAQPWKDARVERVRAAVDRTRFVLQHGELLRLEVVNPARRLAAVEVVLHAARLAHGRQDVRFTPPRKLHVRRVRAAVRRLAKNLLLDQRDGGCQLFGDLASYVRQLLRGADDGAHSILRRLDRVRARCVEAEAHNPLEKHQLREQRRGLPKVLSAYAAVLRTRLDDVERRKEARKDARKLQNQGRKEAHSARPNVLRHDDACDGAHELDAAKGGPRLPH